MKKILVTGAFGQIGTDLVPALQSKYGQDSVVALGHSKVPADFQGVSELCSIDQIDKLRDIIKKYEIDTVFHLVSLLSAKGEQNPQLTWETNMGGLKNILDLAVEFKLKVFWPSTIAAFGSTTPKDNTPQRTVMEPTTMYGVTKVAGELLVQYYHLKFGVDVRSVRYPGIISWKAEPGGGTSDYAVAIFYEAVKGNNYNCFVREDTVMPMMYMDDCVRATIGIMEADDSKLTVRTSYNLAGLSFTVKELADEIKKYYPNFQVTYNPDFRQAIADSWPNSIDDSVARKDWGWQHEFDLSKMTQVMIDGLKGKFKIT
jgi:nucleoside-diphosphate-sugar epimerase